MTCKQKWQDSTNTQVIRTTSSSAQIILKTFIINISVIVMHIIYDMKP